MKKLILIFIGIILVLPFSFAYFEHPDYSYFGRPGIHEYPYFSPIPKMASPLIHKKIIKEYEFLLPPPLIMEKQDIYFVKPRPIITKTYNYHYIEPKPYIIYRQKETRVDLLKRNLDCHKFYCN